jgi:hypothetical protein
MTPTFLLFPLGSGARINLFAFLIDPLGPARRAGATSGDGRSKRARAF